MRLASRYSAEAGSSDEDMVDDGELEESSSGGEEGSRRSAPKRQKLSGSGRTRRNILPRILKGQRCGHCHTCLNPQVLYSFSKQKDYGVKAPYSPGHSF